MRELETEYLVVGSGAVGMAFADVMVRETDATVTIVDRHGKPGGHWNDAYSFVALHQPSAYYGVNSLPLGTGRKDDVGHNAGLYELASGPEISGYYDAVMRQQLIPSGRVTYLPMTDHVGDGRVVSLLTGAERRIRVRRKIVDSTFASPSVPSTHTPAFAVTNGVRLVTPNALPHLGSSKQPPAEVFVIVGAGKTAMDVVLWLLGAGVEPESITWIVPRDSWLLNRARVQPGDEFFEATLGGQAAQMQVFAEAKTVDDLFLSLEAEGLMLRIDRATTPTMFHYATISVGEIEHLRRVTDVVREGRVRSITADGIELDGGFVRVARSAVYVDCTASAVDSGMRENVPIFRPGLIVPQLVRVPQPAFSAAMIAHVEHTFDDDTVKNELCRPVPFPRTLADYPRTNLIGMMNQRAWTSDPGLRSWITNARLDGYGKVIAGVAREDAAKTAVLARLRSFAVPAAENLRRLMSEATATAATEPHDRIGETEGSIA